MKKLSTKFLILGGGLSGLFAAHFLKLHRQECVILEKSDEAGGLARTYAFQGHLFDVGGHRIAFHNPENTAFVKSLVPDLLVLSRRSKIFYDRSYIDYPISFSSIHGLSKSQLGRILFEVAFNNRFSRPRNFEEWIKKHYGRTLYKIVFEKYSRKVWGINCRELCADWARKRIGHYSLLNMLWDEKAKESLRRFYYPRGGIGIIARRLCRNLNPYAALFNKAVIERVKINNGAAAKVECMIGAEKYEINCERLISTIPLKELLRIPPFDANQSLQGLAGSIKYRSLLQVNLVFRLELISDWHWCYFPDEQLLFSRIYEPKYWTAHMSPRRDSTLLCLEIFCDYGDKLWDMPEEELVRRICGQLAGIGLIGSTRECEDFLVVRERYAYPLPFLGYYAWVEKVMRELSAVKNIYPAGRNGMHAYFDIEECLEDVKEKMAEFLYPRTI